VSNSSFFALLCLFGWLVGLARGGASRKEDVKNANIV
jgi:hypothetical protein